MDRILKQDLSKNEVIDLLRGMDAQEVEGNFSVRRVLINTQACDVFGGEPEDSYPLIPGTSWHCITRVLPETRIRSLREYVKT